MQKLFDKAKQYIGKFATSAKKINKPIMTIIVGFLLIAVVLILTGYGVWLYRLIEGKSSLEELFQLLDRVVSPQMVAFITFIAACFVDSDGDSIPDNFDKEDNLK